jgi:hypothetical protein
LSISIKSTTETEHRLFDAGARGALPADRSQALTSEVIEIRRMTYSLRKKILTDAASD